MKWLGPALAFVIAGGVGWFGSHSDEVAEVAEESSVSGVVRPDLSGCGLEDLEASIADIEASNEALYASNRALAEENEIEGVRLAWPEDLPADYEEGAIQRRLEDAMAATPEVRLVALDCSQYPCIAATGAMMDEEQELDAVQAALTDGLEVLEARAGGVVEEMEWYALRYVALGEGELDQEAQDLLRQRIDDVVAGVTIDHMRSVMKE